MLSERSFNALVRSNGMNKLKKSNKKQSLPIGRFIILAETDAGNPWTAMRGNYIEDTKVLICHVMKILGDICHHLVRGQ